MRSSAFGRGESIQNGGKHHPVFVHPALRIHALVAHVLLLHLPLLFLLQAHDDEDHPSTEY